MKKSKKKDKVESLKIPKISTREYVEYLFNKYKKLTTIDLTILIHSYSKSKLPFRNLQAYISTTLTHLKKQGKIMKIGNKEWLWVKESAE